MFRKKMKWYRIGEEQDLLLQISPTKPKPIDVMGRKLILCKTEAGLLTALRDKCPHHGKPLSDGWCEDNKVVCSYHRFSFDLETGLGSGTGVDVYPIEVRGTEVFVGIERIGF